MTLLPVLGNPFLLLDCLIQLSHNNMCLVLFLLVMLCLVDIGLRGLLFLKGNGGRVDLVRGEVRGRTGRNGERGNFRQDTI